ncbi:MAG: hypothetical protein ACK44E_03450 [Anaerolineales bacterium]
MPTYAFRCESCQSEFEAFASIQKKKVVGNRTARAVEVQTPFKAFANRLVGLDPYPPLQPRAEELVVHDREEADESDLRKQ